MVDKITKVLALTLALNDAVDIEKVHYTCYYEGHVSLIDVTKFASAGVHSSIEKAWGVYVDYENADKLLDNMIEQLEAELKEVTKKNDTE